MTQFEQAKQIALQMVASFPMTETGKHYLVLTNSKRVFFDVFIKKYGIDETKTTYSKEDTLRRIRIFEFVPYILRNYTSEIQETGLYIIKSKFHTLIFKKPIAKINAKRQLISLYPHI